MSNTTRSERMIQSVVAAEGDDDAIILIVSKEPDGGYSCNMGSQIPTCESGPVPAEAFEELVNMLAVADGALRDTIRRIAEYGDVTVGTVQAAIRHIAEENAKRIDDEMEPDGHVIQLRPRHPPRDGPGVRGFVYPEH